MTRLTSIAFQTPEFDENYRQRTLDSLTEALEFAGKGSPDLVVLPEHATTTGVRWDEVEFADWCEPIPGPTTDRVSELADKYDMYVCLPIHERDGDTLYNTACFIDREGQIIGKYHKYQPTVGEMVDRGIEPGTDAEVFDTDFGKVGAAICFDIKFVEVGQRLAANGARLVCFGSAFVAGQRLLHWARDFGFYIASSCIRRSYIVDMGGDRFLAETGYQIDEVRNGVVPPMCTAVVNMDREFFHLDENQPRLKECINKYGTGVEWEIYRPEAHFTLASNMPDVTIEEIIEEFGFETWREYLARSRDVRKQKVAEIE
ncbi:MAG: carbon-nitrogen hydrolase family protein [Armatimonadota bacterium]